MEKIIILNNERHKAGRGQKTKMSNGWMDNDKSL